LLVIGSHLYRHDYFAENIILRYTKLWLFNGALGVNIFFIISGFLITTLLIKEKELFNKISLKNFYLRRTIRIFPAYYFLLFIYFILQINNLLYLDPTNWFSNLTYTKQFFPSGDNEAAHLWSLSSEEVFYLIWPFIFSRVNNKSVFVILLLIGIITISRFFQYNYPLPSYTNTIFSTGDSIMVGCLIALYNERIVLFIKKMGNWNFFLFPAIMLFVFIFSRLYYYSSLNQQAGNINSSLFFLQSIAYSLFGNIGLITNIFIGLLIVYSINIKSLWFTFLNNRIMDYIGKLSYSIYLWQQIFTQDKPFFHSFPIILLLVFIFISACISYYLIEKPFLRLKKRYNIGN
jgi:peptidoglycan/LPS O-acetylase OafA/YrhL